MGENEVEAAAAELPHEGSSAAGRPDAAAPSSIGVHGAAAQDDSMNGHGRSDRGHKHEGVGAPQLAPDSQSAAAARPRSSPAASLSSQEGSHADGDETAQSPGAAGPDDPGSPEHAAAIRNDMSQQADSAASSPDRASEAAAAAGDGADSKYRGPPALHPGGAARPTAGGEEAAPGSAVSSQSFYDGQETPFSQVSGFCNWTLVDIGRVHSHGQF